jgi:hypothetical protein
VRVEHHLRGGGEPVAKRLGGRRVPDPEHELGGVLAREALHSEQDVVVGDDV